MEKYMKMYDDQAFMCALLAKFMFIISTILQAKSNIKRM